MDKSPLVPLFQRGKENSRRDSEVNVRSLNFSLPFVKGGQEGFFLASHLAQVLIYSTKDFLRNMFQF